MTADAPSNGAGWGRLRRRAAAGATLSALLGLLLAAPAGAAARHSTAGHSKRIGDTKEAWYSSSPASSTCSLPVGCVQVPGGSAYPRGTLHVGEQVGQESARSYVVPALSHLPKGATPTAGQLVLPVATASGDGSTNVAAAKIQACLVTGTVTDGVDGSTGKAPAVDCAVHAVASYAAKSQTFTVNLGKLLAAWRSGTPYQGIALLPVTAGSTPTDTWQVTFDGRHLPHPVAAVVSYRLLAAAGSPVKPSSGGGNAPPAPAPAQGPAGNPPANVPVPSGAGSVPGSGANAPQLAGPPQVAGPAPSVAPPSATRPVALTSHGFAYPMVFLLPLVLLAGVVFFARMFTANPLQVKRA